ncbi:uncharacterized protein NCU10291 [Aspergillus awamori]|uniref:Contig An14c0170, genomic contig n=7 Tax=Aspergillus TaxID=5052 RepID=A2R3K8_ASPNC|nr:uncharacterized protein An14g04640 [Aspergillus niger]XP_025456798.1 PLAC8-domain-containing protein [Aspergillus niger CBS 101883]XP_026631004.1 PLAC8 family-domain-containing protein [Aspergillus welwitschiae]EHA27884.1 hypothetical protein ASPNIDRAFT_53850 [Aspergillus niger ATCC 1015]RDH25696.1 PLAC8-domain-containing protein [Aspergillus niger ATCC 13496]RDK40901.1 PLAC8-domain-containing protein [Aspergillus phoenicis ATCC 13157]GCB19192.1 uncharacterized protein NCU10291 [Aspergillu|eukprot:XP_001401088.1 hypothetical protein ANI_1_646124 [Aspergillus niger CBS 513.88]
MNRQLQLNTSNLGSNPRYSYMETPLEMHAPGSRLRDEITPPAATTNTQSTESQTVMEHFQPPVNEKSQQYQQDMAVQGYPCGPNLEQHPANYAPYADEIQQVQQNPKVPEYSYAQPPQSPGPLPVKKDLEMSEPLPNKQPMAVVPDTNPLHSPQLPQFPPPVAHGAPATPAGFDLMAYHRPGQITHPDLEIKGGSWRTSMCGCYDVGSCCLGLLCPCILFGKTQYRLSMKSRSEDPTNMLGYETCNSSCTAMALACGCQCFLATFQRRRTRKAYKIEGDIVSDCVRATCCTCCTLIQNEVEIKKREEERGRYASATGAALVSPYLPPTQMSYGPPPR